MSMDQSNQRQTPNAYSAGGSVHDPNEGDQKIEDLPLEKKLEILKKYNPYEFYDEGRYIDAQDTVNAWCLGQILQVDNKSLNIHFDGWSSRWDIWQKVTSYKIAPFRKISRGYTGQNKIALRQNMKFNLDELHTQKQRIEKLIENELNGLGAFETTQYFRGQLYIYVDFLLQGGPYTEENIDAINDFLYCVLRLIVTWLKKLPKIMHLYSQIKVNPDLFLIDENIAILLCAYEFLDILKKFFCSCHRCVRYYMLHDKTPVKFDHAVTQSYDHINFEAARKKDEEDIDIDEVKEMIALRKNIIFGQFMNFINYFAEIGGFDAIIDYLKLGNDQEEKIPLEMISLVTQPFRNCNSIFAPTFAHHFVQSVKDVVVNRLKTMTEKELKEIDKESVGRVLNDLRDFFYLSMNENETAELIENNQLNIALRFLKSTYLEKRLKGISDIKLLIERIEWGLKQAQLKSMQASQGFIKGGLDQDVMGMRQMKPPKWLTAEILRDWILQYKVLDIVFGENTHLEIVKRSSCILKFLAKQLALPQETIELIWRCQLGKHEEMVRVVFSTIQELVPFLTIEQIDLFYIKMQQVPAQQYDDKFLEFLKDFTMKSLENYYEIRSSEGSMSESSAHPYDELIRKREYHVINKFGEFLNQSSNLDSQEKQYGLPIFWELIQDKAPQVSTEIMQICINSIVEILKQNYSQPIKINYLLKAVENIMKGESICQSIIIAQNIISDYPNYEFSENSVSQQSIITQLEKQLNLINQIIQNLGQYHQNVKEKLKQMSEKKKTLPEDVSNFVFVGKHPHEQSLNHILEFIEFLIANTNQEVTLGNNNIDKLWQIFVQQPNFNQDQNLFLKWINLHREQGYDKREYFLFTDEERKYFFTKILCNPTYVDFQKISIGQVKCFHKYFKVINKQEENLDIIRKRMRVVQYNKLIGLDTLWRIALESENERSREESMDLLVDIHLKFDPSVTQQDQLKIWANFIENCMRNLGSDNDSLVSNTIQLLSKLLDRYEGRKTLKPEFKQSHFTNLQPLNVTVLNRSDNQRRQVHVSYFQTIGFLRQKIAEAFDMQINEFSMSIKNQYADPDEDDDKYIKDVGLIQSVIIQKNPAYNPENHPKFLISNNQANYDQLFFLLSKEKPSIIEATWDLLQKLPVNGKLQQEIKELVGVMENKSNWEKILDPKSTNKLLYSLKIINNLHGNRKDQKAQQWRYKFVQMGGFNHLLKTFVQLDIKSIDTNLTMKCIENLITILFEFISSDKDLIKQVIETKDQILYKSINLIDLIGDYCINVEKKRGESYEDISKRIQQNKQKKNKYKSYMASNKQGADNKQQQQTQQNQEEEEDHDNLEYNLQQQIVKHFNEDTQIVMNLFRFMYLTIFNHDQSAVTLVTQYPNLENMLLKTTIMNENFYLRNEILRKFKEMICMRSQTQDMKAMINVLKILIFNIQPYSEKYETRSYNFFDGVAQIIDQLLYQDIESLKDQLEVVIHELTKFILNREIKEKNTQESDMLLTGKIKLLKSLLQKLPHLKEPVGKNLTEHLIHNCLFEVPQGGTSKNSSKAGPPKCKSQSSRLQAVRLLAVLCRDCLPNLDYVLTYLQKFNQNPSWRTNKDHDWNISLMESEKSSTGYVGLKNLGCICYMNSLFQQLFMLQSLRNDILSVKDNTNVEKEENMLYQLQLLFAGLLKSEKQFVSPKGFCHAFKDWEGQPTNVLEQMDVEEFFNMLMDRIETAIKGSPQQNTIQYHFGGKFASEMICKGCPHYYERQEPYLSLSIPVKNKKSIIEGLNAFIQGEMLEGDNAYLCEKCDKKVDTLKRTCLKKLPRYLIIALRRFEFDYDKMIRVKVNDYCEFPMELNMEPFTQEGLQRREKLAKMKEERGDDATTDDIEMEPLKYPQEYYDYQLSGIVVHSGTADSGHYYSFIKDREHPESGKWYEMNDHIVREFDPNEIPQECFGGEDTFQAYNMVQMKSMKWRNAYLLFYERKVPIDIHSDDEKENEKSSTKEDVEMQVVKTGSEISILSEIEEKIAYENQKYWQNRFLFGNEYHEFVYDISLNWNTSFLIPKFVLTKNNDFHIVGHPMPKEYEKDLTINDPLDVKLPLNEQLIPLYEERVFKFAAGFYVTILQRAQHKQFIPQMLNLLKGYINQNYKCAQWLLSEFCNYKILEENFLQCSQKEMRKFTAGILYCAMLKVYQVERTELLNYWQNPQDPNNNKTVLGNFALVLIYNIFQLKKFVANCSQYFQLIARFSSLGPEAREFLLKAKCVGRLMEFLFDEVSPHKDFFRDMSDINPQYKEKCDIGVPTEIDRKQMSQFQEMLEKRRMKNLSEAPPKYKYLLEAVSNCIRAYKNGDQKSPYQTDDVNFEQLQSQERDLFIPDSKFLKRVFSEAKKNRAVVAVCTAYCHFAWTEKEAFHELLGVIQQGLQDNDYDDLKPFLSLQYYILKNPGGENPDQRFEVAMQNFLDTIKHLQMYYKFMETIYEFIFKITSKIPQVKEWFKQRKSQWQWLVEWSENTRFPVNLMDPNTNVRLLKKRGNIQLHQQYLKGEAYRNQAVREARNKRLEMLLKGEVPDLSSEVDMDLIDMQDYKFIVGEQIEMYHRRQDRLMFAQIEQVLDEMINTKYLQFNQNNQMENNFQGNSSNSWIACDTDKLLPYGTYKSQYRQFERMRNQNAQNTNNPGSMRQGGNDGDYDMGDGTGMNYNNNIGDSDDEGDESDQENLYT